MEINEIKINEEYEKLVPALSELEYNSLKESIKNNGLWHRITINKNNEVLDGHHRLKIGKELGYKEIETEVMTFPNELYEKLFVIDSNLKRRHFNTFRRVELALKKKPIYEKIAKLNMSLGGKGDKNLTPLGRIDERVAKDAETSRGTVRKVEAILEKGSDEAVKKLKVREIKNLKGICNNSEERKEGTTNSGSTERS